ncbi:ribonuclease H-like domain-containing protein [Tanacetum coccineum]
MTLSEPLQVRLVVEDPHTAKEAWDHIATIFHDNKYTRTIALKARTICGYLALKGELKIRACVDINHRNPFLDLKTCSGDLYPVTKQSTSPIAFLSTSASTWHQRLRHPGDQGSQVAYLLIYVDDIILTTSCPTLIQQIIGSLNNEFDMTDLGALNYFLGISADRTPTGLFLSQKKYALQLLEHAHMVTCNPSRTPIDTESKLGPEGVPVQDWIRRIEPTSDPINRKLKNEF